MGGTVVEDGGNSSLKDFKLEIINNEGDVNSTFTLCFWLYLPADSSPFPSTLLHQYCSDITSATPFLVMNENKEMMLYPIRFRPQKEPNPSHSTQGIEVPLDKWVHIGFEVSSEIQRLYLNGEIVRETRVTCDFGKDSEECGSRNVFLVGSKEYESIDGYVHGVKIFPILSSVKDHFVKDPPVQLLVDSSSAIDVEEESDGVWGVVGGKASCRRNFSLDVVLTDAFGHSMNKEMEVVASLMYADTGALVEKPEDAEAPLLTSYDGIEFASWDRPSKLINGRASFKLKISQLSSKCDNRLFRIKFDVPKLGRRYPFFEAFSRPVRCISRNRNTRPSTLIWKRSTVEPVHNIIHEAKPSPSSKRIKLALPNPFMNLKSDKPETREETDNSSSDSDTNSCNGSLVSDLTVFKYCLGSLAEKSLLLKEIATSASEQVLEDFGLLVSRYSGCLHHRDQIGMSKRLIDEGTKAWHSISQNNHHVLWNNVIPVIRDQFTKITCCRIRFLTPQDFEVLRRIGGCQEVVGQESFEKLWCWLYPVAFALLKNGLNEMWDSRWIEGFVTKEEVEASLQGQDPGTFVLRFPTSRSWPHPDAGNLIVTYVGSDYGLHHRLLALDFIHCSEGGVKSLKETLLEERQLSRLGRITTRSLRLV